MLSVGFVEGFVDLGDLWGYENDSVGLGGLVEDGCFIGRVGGKRGGGGLWGGRRGAGGGRGRKGEGEGRGEKGEERWEGEVMGL